MNDLQTAVAIMLCLSLGGVLALAVYEYIKHGNSTK